MHTPGPWHYVTGAAWTTPAGPDDGGQCIATRASKATIDPCTKDANLRLIAAAPDLLAALQRLTNYLDGKPGTLEERRHSLQQARAAIRKALGD